MSAYSTDFDRAVQFAMEHFRPIVRKGSGAPYITHLFAVTALVGEHGGDEEQLIAAMLHDAIEDIPGVTAALIEREFGARVARLVVSLSDCEGRPKPPWRERKEAYLAHLANEPAEVKLISAADKLHNARSILIDHQVVGDAIFDRFTPPREGTLWYYASLPKALAHNGWDSPLLWALREAVDKMHAL